MYRDISFSTKITSYWAYQFHVNAETFVTTRSKYGIESFTLAFPSERVLGS